MTYDEGEEIIKALTATYELLGQQISAVALTVIADDLEPYGLESVLKALASCRKEVRGRLTPADIIDRIRANAGRPAPNEAWARCLPAADELVTVVWTSEMSAAWFAAWPVLQAGDEVGARMAFIESYKRAVAEAEDTPPRWEVCLGHDPEQRAVAVQQAVEQGLLGRDTAARYLPAPEAPAAFSVAGLLTGNVSVSPTAPEETKRRIREIVEMIESGESWDQRRARERVEQAQREQDQKAEALRLAEQHIEAAPAGGRG